MFLVILLLDDILIWRGPFGRTFAVETALLRGGGGQSVLGE